MTDNTALLPAHGAPSRLVEKAEIAVPTARAAGALRSSAGRVDGCSGPLARGVLYSAAACTNIKRHAPERGMKHAGFRSLSVLLAAIGAVAAHAEVQVSPYVAAEYEHTSNIFYEWGGVPATVGRNGAARGDTIRALRGGLDARISWSRQKLFVIAEARRFDYHNFNSLDHYEGLLDGSLDWQLARLLDGSLEYRHERRMVPFSELAAARNLLLETEDVGTASMNVQVAPAWRWENRVKIRNLDSPRPGLPRLSLREYSLHEGVRYLVAAVAVGLDGEYLDGKFGGATGLAATAYRQSTAQLAGEYQPSGRSSLNGAIGYTRRNGLSSDGVSAVTGVLRYQCYFTGKTSATLQLLRGVNSYVTTAGTEVDTGASLQATWQPTTRIQVSPGLSLMRSEFPGQTFGSATVRRDHFESFTLDIEYQTFDWLSVHPYGRYNFRSSTIAGFGFNVTEVGVELRVKVPE